MPGDQSLTDVLGRKLAGDTRLDGVNPTRDRELSLALQEASICVASVYVSIHLTSPGRCCKNAKGDNRC